ncbi:unnamed protein product [Linum trigynum]|uniref:Uncharacterized protein n=1 Tax=Linum trigynum TaxID=586398 RepID=A0AAV2FE84_9ROSI
MEAERDLPVRQDTQPQSQRGQDQRKQAEKPGKESGRKKKMKENGDQNKGKEKLITSGPTKDKGLLGPRPGLPDAHGGRSKSTAKDSVSSASTSSMGRSLTKEDVAAQKNPPSESSSDFSTQVVKGAHGTTMRIIQVSEYPSTVRPVDPSAPSTVTRTRHMGNKDLEKQEGKQAKSKKGTPMRNSPSKALQIWTPKKDKKTKARERRVSVTLQQIEAWTASKDNEKEAESLRGKEGASRSEEGATSPPGDFVASS